MFDCKRLSRFLAPVCVQDAACGLGDGGNSGRSTYCGDPNACIDVKTSEMCNATFDETNVQCICDCRKSQMPSKTF